MEALDVGIPDIGGQSAGRNHLLWGAEPNVEVDAAKCVMLISLAAGALLVMLYPLIRQHSKPFAVFGLGVGLMVIALTIYVAFGDPIMRHQILKYGWQ